ncbi:MAG: hypothetical protein HRT72_02840 [Flavobacteriales bacterium]|nr:hypothetical protein [Flavobacteriales bacterium]
MANVIINSDKAEKINIDSFLFDLYNVKIASAKNKARYNIPTLDKKGKRFSKILAFLMLFKKVSESIDMPISLCNTRSL